MPNLPVHIGVLAVAKDGAPTQSIGELAIGAGHKVVARTTVMDSQLAIRTQLQRWIDDPNVDVVIVSGDSESTSTSAALKALATETLPGFTDLFRYLAFQEIGASAMLSNAEAARCNSTFVFVLPASDGAVRAAMSKLILPQLDASTAPKNLVTEMPRLKALAGDAVPKPIAMEKTAGGSGLSPKMPGIATPPRGRPITGANVIRKQETLHASEDPPTRPIDVVRLEQQIALSSQPNESPTKRVDLSRLPKLPPGADPSALADEEILQGSGPSTRQPRAESEPIAPPPPLLPAAPPVLGPSKVVPSTRTTQPVAVAPPVRASTPKLPSMSSGPTTSSSGSPASSDVPTLPRIKAPSGPISTLSGNGAKTVTGPAVIDDRPRRSSGAMATVRGVPTVPTLGPDRTRPPSGPRTRPPSAPPQPRAKAPSTPPPPPGSEQGQAKSGSTPAADAPRAKAPSTPPPLPTWTKAPSPPPPAASATTASSSEPVRTRPSSAPPPVPSAAYAGGDTDTVRETIRDTVKDMAAQSGAADDAAPEGGRRRRPRPSTDSAPLGAPTQAIPIVSVPEGVELTPLAIESGPMPGLTGARRAGSDSDVVTSSARPMPPLPPRLPDPAMAVRLAPPPVGDFEALAARPLGESAADLPLGEFQYPIKKNRGGKVIWLLALLAAGALGFVAVVYLVPLLQKRDVAASAPPPAAPPAGSEAPIVAAATPPPVAAPVEADAALAAQPDATAVAQVQPPPVADTPVPPATPAPSDDARGKSPGGKSSPGKPGTGKGTKGGNSDPKLVGSGSGDEPEQEPPIAPPITESDCDEVACVLAKYNKPCCERYRPKEPEMKPRGAGGVPTELDKVAVRAGIQTVKPAVVACGEKHPAKGTVKIAVKVKPDGSVTDASVDASPDGELGSCVAAALHKAQFAKTTNGGSFTYPFVF